MNAPLHAIQPALPGFCEVTEAVQKLSLAGAEERGAVFTRSEVVDFILDLVGYRADAPLHEMRLLEPSAGDGDFLFRAVERLLSSAKRDGKALAELSKQVRVIELHQQTFEATRERLRQVLLQHAASAEVADELIEAWVIQGDFLLQAFDQTFTHVVGNPPYVRQELIPSALLAEYRRRYVTLFDRADLYVPFIERSLSLLEPGGKLGFICADRWMKNKYGGPLRALVAGGYHLQHFVDMVDTPAFHSDVIAYPAITTIAKAPPGPTRVVQRPVIDAVKLARLSTALTAEVANHPQIIEVEKVADGSEPWILEDFARLRLVRRLEASLPALEEADCRVGIGVATGADNAFIGPFDELDVEPVRKLPLSMRADLADGGVEWRGLGVVNPFLPDGKLASFSDYPKFAAYLEARRQLIDRRHIAQKNPRAWYRTIDRIHADISGRPKLLIPDIAGEAIIAFEDEGLYPHHNLYFVLADSWDLRALQAVLMSGIAKLFVATYSTKMRGGYLRFQAQYLRRIRVPHWHDVPNGLREDLADAAQRNDRAACDALVAKLYGLTAEERDILSAI